MAAKAYFLGLDIRRDGLTLLLVDRTGQTVLCLQRGYGGQDGIEQDPQDWWRATRTGIKELLRRSGVSNGDIRAVGVTGPGDAPVLLDENGTSLGPTVIGPDERFDEATEALSNAVGARNLANLTGARAHGNCLAVKLLWLRDNERRMWHDAKHILAPQDFLRFRLTEQQFTDPSTACRSLLFSPRNRGWSKQVLHQLEIPLAWLPTIVPGTQLCGCVTEQAGRETGLQAGTPIVTGANHDASAAAALGILEPGDTMIELGDHGNLYSVAKQARRDTKQRLMLTCHSIGDYYAYESLNVVDGRALQWLMEEGMPGEVQQAKRAKREPLDHLAELAAETPPGAEGLLFCPPQADTAGAFIGLQPTHSRGHLIRSVLEGGVLNAAGLFPALEELGSPARRVVVTGPGAGTTLWCQMLADAIDLKVTACVREAVAARGAAAIAATAVGAIDHPSKLSAKLSKNDTVYEPRRSAHKTYIAIMPRRLETLNALDNGSHAEIVGAE